MEKLKPGGEAVSCTVYGWLPLVNVNENVAHWPGQSTAEPLSVPAGPVLIVTVAEAVPVHPEGSVTVTVYVPLKVITLLGSFGLFPPLQT